MMKLFWSTRSPFVRKVMMIAHELHLQDRIETIRIVVHPADPNSELMAYNPLGKIPTLILNDGSVICDSRVICEYLDTTYGTGSLIPTAPAERWRTLTWQALADAMMEVSLLWLGERAKVDGVRNDEIVAGCRRRIVAALDRLEQDEEFRRAPSPTLGHFSVASALLYLDFRFASEPWRTGRLELSLWLEGISRRPSVASTSFADIY